MKNYKIKEIAIKCGVSDESIRKWCRKHDVSKDEKGKFLIDDDVKDKIVEHYKGTTKRHNHNQKKAQPQPQPQPTETAKNEQEKPQSQLESTTTTTTTSQGCATGCVTDYAAEMIEFLKEQIKEKDKQIDSLNDRLTETIKLMDQEQQLRLVAEKQLEKKQLIIENETAENNKRWWEFWK